MLSLGDANSLGNWRLQKQVLNLALACAWTRAQRSTGGRTYPWSRWRDRGRGLTTREGSRGRAPQTLASLPTCP